MIMLTAIVANVANAATSQSVRFQEAVTSMSTPGVDTSETDRAAQYAALRAAYEKNGNQPDGKVQDASSALTCDTDLRKCMTDKCGEGFTKCKNDSTTIWGNKIASCRAKTKCTAHEYETLAPEILADRDANVRTSYYKAVIQCGDNYNKCIFDECGSSLKKCLAKKDGDRAISKCASIANNCREQDSGLASRAMSTFGDLRQIATKRVSHDEARLYELRNLMRESCNRLGAMFDERTLDCVYTVNFFAGQDATTPMASKKLYAGDTFQCNADWFGIDVTTYLENAYRRTSAQKSASAAMWAGGVGTAAGLWASGAPQLAIKTQNAKQALQQAEQAKAEQECQDQGKEYSNGQCVDNNNQLQVNADNISIPTSSDSTINNQTKPSKEVTSTSTEINQENDDFKRPNAQGTKPTKSELDLDQSGRECRRYYTDEWCDDYYKNVNISVFVSFSSKNHSTPKLECEGNQGRRNISTMLNRNEKLLTLKNVSKDATCTISAEGCETQTFQAQALTANPNVELNCSEKRNNDTSNVDIKVQVKTKNNVILNSSINCTYKDSNGQSFTDRGQTNSQTHQVMFYNIPYDSVCTVTASECYDTSNQIGVIVKIVKKASEFGSTLVFECPLIDDCFDSGGKWKNNKCDCGDGDVPNYGSRCSAYADATYGYYHLDKSAKDLSACNITSPGDWCIKTGLIFGKSFCSSRPIKNHTRQAVPEEDEKAFLEDKGGVCYCKVTNTANSETSSWISLEDDGNNNTCEKHCAKSCAENMQPGQNFRNTVNKFLKARS